MPASYLHLLYPPQTNKQTGEIHGGNFRLQARPQTARLSIGLTTYELLALRNLNGQTARRGKSQFFGEKVPHVPYSPLDKSNNYLLYLFIANRNTIFNK